MLSKLENQIQILNSKSSVWSVMEEMTQSENQEEAFYVCDIGNIIKKYLNWKKLMPRVETYYAVKCNDHPFVLETLATLGTGFDCASKEEISKILDLNVQPTRIIFANPAKPESHIKYAETVNILRMTFDNQLELEKIKRSHPNAELILRIKYDDEMAHYKFGGKFGCDHLTEAPELLTKAQQLGIKVIGVSFHIGSGSQNPKVYGEAIKAARHVFDLASNIGFKFNILDIGGGFPGAHGTSIEEISKNVNENINLHFSDPSIKIVAEPGRYYVDSAFTVATRIHSIATTKPDSTGIFTYMYYVNTGAYSTFMNVFFNEQYKPQALNKNKRDKKYPTIIWGPTCDSLDKICEKNKMPKMNIGDWIAFENMGAYTLTISSNFNGFPIPKVHGVVCEKLWKKYKHLMMGSEIKFDNCKEHLRCQLSEKLLYSNKFSSVN
ncbi:unnamed protein product [Brassicogethes aeneus]|uniref:ornithine decarboxylase n=1 Tax=Brassicogethes aeneus TaxID=1431903 RepID=A0A9P0FCH5_BRAAE|nr:unnamed protein product [Brassicogethes aeneus]